MAALIRTDRAWTTPGSDQSKPIRFCSRCGHPREDPPGRPGLIKERVCSRCGMGVMLTCSRDAMPGDAAAFLIVTYQLDISAVSIAGERIFGKEETLVGRPLLEVVTSPMGDDQLTRDAGLAAQQPSDPVVMPLRVTATNRARAVGTLAARIATCGPPRAALVTVEPSGFGRR
jgi:hypothetical protein